MAVDLLDIKKNGEETKIFFACFPFISEQFRIPYIQRKFYQLIKNIGGEDSYKESLFASAIYSFHGRVNTSEYVKFLILHFQNLFLFSNKK